MLLVVTIIGILAALVIPKIVGSGEQARSHGGHADINGGIKSALDAYEVDNGFYPKSLQDLIAAAVQREELARAVSTTSCRRIRGAILTFIIIPANTTPIPTTCCRSGRTARKERTMTLATGQQ